MATIFNAIISVALGALGGAIKYSYTQSKKRYTAVQAENQALKLGMQALLRDRLLSNYKAYALQGYVEPDDKDNWLNLYNQYHSLGANGVMDSVKIKFMDLPDFAEVKNENIN